MMIELFISNLTNFSLSCFLLAALLSVGSDVKNRRPISLERAVVRAVSLATTPTGVAFILSAFNPGLVQRIEGGQLGLMIAGCIFIFISVKYGMPDKTP